MRYYLAIDIGASSGRHIIGWQEKGIVMTQEVYRFPNKIKTDNAHLIWDVERLFSEVKEGIRRAFAAYPKIESLSIDTWGVDYVLMEGNQEIWPCYAYRDSRTEKVIPNVHRHMSFEELYRRTGCQFQPFNSIYQLYEDKLLGRLDKATEFLMLPEYLLYCLTGVKKKEYTNATTTGLISADTGGFDLDIIQSLGLSEKLFTGEQNRLYQPGTILGSLTPEIASEVGGQCLAVLCATHDTASAVEGIPMKGNHPYISSGTWSLLGVKTAQPVTNEESRQANYSNEGGVGYNRYQKNIMGLWLVQCLQKELCPGKYFDEIVKEAQKSKYHHTVDANSPEFLAPNSMRTAIARWLQERTLPLPVTEADYFNCAYRSLAESYHTALKELEKNTKETYRCLYIVGGGAKNTYLNRLTEEATGKHVLAFPIEASALGNLKLQMEGKE